MAADTEISPLLCDYPVVVTLPVQWGEQDLYGHVNNAVYFRWYETARVAYAERVGFTQLLETHGLGPILAAIQCNYRRQLKYPDQIQIGARVTRLGRSSFNMEHRLISLGQQEIVADGDSTIVCFNYAQQRSARLPEEMRRAVEALEGKSLAEFSEEKS